jgi:membrane protease YdiL (CAAX protease family)
MTAEGAVERDRPRTGAIVAWSVLALLQVGAGLATLAADEGADDTSNPLFEGQFIVTSLVVYSILILLTVGIASGYSLDLKRTLGFRPFELRWLGVAAGVIVATLIVGAIMGLFGDAAEEQGLAPDRWEPGKAEIFVVAALIVVLFVPFAEELFFRGLGVGILGFAGPAVAVGIPALAFALAHGILLALPTLLVLGGGLAWIRYRSQSLWPCVIAHSAWNGLALAVAASSF